MKNSGNQMQEIEKILEEKGIAFESVTIIENGFIKVTGEDESTRFYTTSPKEPLTEWEKVSS